MRINLSVKTEGIEMRYLSLAIIAIFLMSPAMFVLLSTIVHQDNTYDTHLIVIVSVLFLVGLSLSIISTRR